MMDFWYSISIVLGSVGAYYTLSKLIRSARTVNEEEYSTLVPGIIGKIFGKLIDIKLMI